MANSILTILLIAFATAQVAFATYANYPPCDPPHSPDYGGYGPIKTKYHVGSKIKYYCNDGYRRHGALWSVCRYSKKSHWAYPTPVCKPIKCPDLHDPTYGSVHVTGYIQNSIARYTCNPGYRLVGYEQRRCSNGQWTSRTPVCRKIIARCPYRGDPPYGSIKATGYTPGSTVHYICKKGFELDGEAWQKCLYTGYWSGEEPVCRKIVQCPDLDDPQYGNVNVTDNTPGSTAQYECDEGYDLVGNPYRECLNNGYWSGEEPVCKRIIICPDLYDPPHGYVNVSNNTSGSTAHYECDKAYELVGDEYRECLNTGYWSGEEPECKRIIRCPIRDNPPYGLIIRVTGYTPGSSIHYVCKKGFELVGDAWQKCLYTGYWSGEEPVCKQITTCPELDDPQYGSVNYTYNTPGATAHYKCNKGFKLVGDEYRECIHNGYWSGKEPVCKRISCPHLEHPSYGKVIVRGNTPSSRAHYICNQGYELVGLTWRQCQYDGSWYGDAPTCHPTKKIVCPHLDPPNYGKVLVRSYTPSSIAYYSCDYGYKLQGSQYRKCLRDGSWYGSAPTCYQVNH